MKVKQQMTELEELMFQLFYGSIFAISLDLDYYETLQQVLTDKSDRYTINKVKEAVRACKVVYNLISFRLLNGLEDEQAIILKEAIEVQKNLAYTIFSLNGEQQEKVKEFIKELQC